MYLNKNKTRFLFYPIFLNKIIKNLKQSLPHIPNHLDSKGFQKYLQIDKTDFF